jgi:predicted ester cyclase
MDKIYFDLISGRHEGEFQGIPPTGNQVSITGLTMFRIANGKIVEGWTNADRLGLMQQIGAVSSPEQG